MKIHETLEKGICKKENWQEQKLQRQVALNAPPACSYPLYAS